MVVYKIRSEFEGGMKKLDALLPGVSGPQQGADISVNFGKDIRDRDARFVVIHLDVVPKL